MDRLSIAIIPNQYVIPLAVVVVVGWVIIIGVYLPAQRYANRNKLPVFKVFLRCTASGDLFQSKWIPLLSPLGLRLGKSGEICPVCQKKSHFLKVDRQKQEEKITKPTQNKNF